MWKAEKQLTEIMDYRRIMTRSVSSKYCRKRQDGVINIGSCFQAEITDIIDYNNLLDRDDILITYDNHEK